MNELLIAEAQVLFERIKDYDLSKIIERHRRDSDVDLETAEKRAMELKKWLVMAKVNPENTYQITGNIDKIWHTFIMFTKEYYDFCEELGKFIHHSPADTVIIREARTNPELMNSLRGQFITDYTTVLNDYEGVFQITPPNDIWPNVFNPYAANVPDHGESGCGTRCGCGGGQGGPNH